MRKVTQMASSKARIASNIKNEELINVRRQELVNAAVKLFVKKGFHKTTVREIAKEFGMSMGALYDYIRTKEDILFLVCDHIFKSVSDKLQVSAGGKENAKEKLKNAIRDYFIIIDSIQDYTLLLYQETKSLNRKDRNYVLSAEMELTKIFENIIAQGIKEKTFNIDKHTAKIVANNIMVQGQMWSFRRWVAQKNYSLNNYIQIQTDLTINGIS
ncbi:MAG: TetR/AcrR family transcriptional regulator [Candidatus Dadabacteria bacterium]|nr:MAG: TetR/AcrR family transcriptional regulator [Candidatus Dadabacteria bacterium]